MTHRVALTGLRQAKEFIGVFNALPDTEVVALCDIDEAYLKEVGESSGIESLYTDFEKMMDADFDIVVLSTPIQVHGEQAIVALQAGKHVLCQYIAAMNPEEASRLVDAATASGKKYMTMETDCYERKNRIMMALADRGALGELTMGRGHYIHDCKSLGYNPDGSLTWRGELWNLSCGGVSSAVHTSLPLLQTFKERIVELYSYGPGARTLPEFSWYDRITTAGKLASGRIVELAFDVMSYYPLTCGYYLQGTQGCFEFERGAVVRDGKLSAWMDLDELASEFDLGEVASDFGGHHSAWASIIHEFVKSIDEDSRPPQDLFDALHMTAIGWAVEESLQTGQPVKVQTFD